MNGKLVSLSKARKARARAEAKTRADENAVKHGRTKAERAAEARRAERQEKALDGAKRDD
ncbi:DUF4169 family protein [Hasllibacter sp. MH4015]|uniref:DUF4169 family protein n=1 Tax=Hasllibacter sp. MH4015 TaxID=2854029 RepID=UPI001CD26EFE|nr:DUF4169 family protein [Hasllibacter sp. MH4015]